MADPQKWTKLHKRLRQVLQLKHDHLVTYHKVTFALALGGVTVELMMDYCTGGDLASLLKTLAREKTLLYQAEALRYATEIATGLQFLHQNNIIHGDLKPGNVLIKLLSDRRKSLVIADLDDFVQIQHSVTKTSDITHLRGTIRYMSPEMLNKFTTGSAEAPGRKTDIWSLGCVMLELADRIAGINERWLCRSTVKEESGDEIPDTRYAILVIDGFVPLVSSLIPEYIACCIRSCLRQDTTKRITADAVVVQLHFAHKEFVKYSRRNLFQELSYGSYGDRSIAPHSNSRNRSAPAEIVVIIIQRKYPCKGLAFIFAPSTDSVPQILHPVSLPNSAAEYPSNFVAVGKDVIYQTQNYVEKQCETVVWNPLKQKFHQLTSSFDSNVLMGFPIAVDNKICFWTEGDLLPSYNALDVTNEKYTLLRTPVFHKPIWGNAARCGNQIIYAGPLFPWEKISRWMGLYDTVLGQWEMLPDLPGFREGFAMVVHRKSEYTLGGFDLSSNEQHGGGKSCCRLNLRTRTWEKIQDMLQPRMGHCAFVLHDRVYAFGGRANDTIGIFATMEVYDAMENTWSYVSLGSDELRTSEIDRMYALNVTL